MRLPESQSLATVFINSRNSRHSAVLTVRFTIQDTDGNTTVVGALYVVLDCIARFERSSTRVKWTTILIASSGNNILVLPDGERNRYGVIAPTVALKSLRSLERLGGTSGNIAIFFKRHQC